MKSQLIAKVVMSGFTGGAFAAYDQRLNRHAVADSQIRHSLAYLRYLAGKLMPHYHRSDFLRYRIKVRLTEEEKEKLERNSALCGLTQSEYVRQLCRGIHPKPKPPDVFWRLMDELYKAHSDLKECAKYEPSALKLCAEIERLVLDLQEAI